MINSLFVLFNVYFNNERIFSFTKNWELKSENWEHGFGINLTYSSVNIVSLWLLIFEWSDISKIKCFLLYLSCSLNHQGVHKLIVEQPDNRLFIFLKKKKEVGLCVFYSPWCHFCLSKQTLLKCVRVIMAHTHAFSVVASTFWKGLPEEFRKLPTFL